MRAISGASGILTHAADYSPYGTPLTMSDSPSSFGFAGEMTESSGLTYLRARYYHPTSGTFLSQDPVLGVVGGPASTFNPYLYVRGNPVNWTDPSGEIVPLLLLAGAAAIGAIAGAAFDILSQLALNGWNLDCINLGSVVQSALLGAVSGIAGFVLGAAGVGCLAAFLIGGAVDFVGGMIVDMGVNKMSFENALVGNLLSFGVGGAVALAGHGLGKIARKFFGSADVNLKPALDNRVEINGRPNANPQTSPTTERFYRAMSESEYAKVAADGKLSIREGGGSHELFITDKKEYVQGLMSRSEAHRRKYPILVEFEVEAGTTARLQSKEVAKIHPSLARTGRFPEHKIFQSGDTTVQLKLERGGVLSYGLGAGTGGLDIFNNAIIGKPRRLLNDIGE